MAEPILIGVGATERQMLAVQVLTYTLHKHSRRKLEVVPLHRAGIRAVVSLVKSPSDRSVYATAGLDFLCLPIPDGWPPTAEQVDAFVVFAVVIIAGGDERRGRRAVRGRRG